MSSQPPTLGRKFSLRRDPALAASSFDPCAGIEFSPGLGSDELFEALKQSFPRCKNHKARVREAVIDFLIAEREAERSRSQSPEIVRSSRHPPNEQHSERTGVGKQAPAKLSSKGQEAVPPNEGFLAIPKPAKAASTTDSDNHAAAERPSPVDRAMPDGGEAKTAINELTIIWNSVDGLVRNPRSKRVMTKQDLEQYRLRRALGACKVCKSQKRKCTHNPQRPSPSSTDNCQRQIIHPSQFSEISSLVPSIENESWDQVKPLPSVLQELHPNDLISFHKESQDLTQEPNQMSQTDAYQRKLSQSVEYDESELNAVPNAISGQGESVSQESERASQGTQPPRARFRLPPLPAISSPEIQSWNEWPDLEPPSPAHTRNPTLSPVLSTTIPPGLLRREPCSEEAPTHSGRRKRVLSPKLGNLSSNLMQKIKDVGQHLKRASKVTHRTTRKPSRNRFSPFSRINPLDHTYLVDSPVITREAMLDPYEGFGYFELWQPAPSGPQVEALSPNTQPTYPSELEASPSYEFSPDSLAQLAGFGFEPFAFGHNRHGESQPASSGMFQSMPSLHSAYTPRYEMELSEALFDTHFGN